MILVVFRYDQYNGSIVSGKLLLGARYHVVCYRISTYQKFFSLNLGKRSFSLEENEKHASTLNASTPLNMTTPNVTPKEKHMHINANFAYTLSTLLSPKKTWIEPSSEKNMPKHISSIPSYQSSLLSPQLKFFQYELLFICSYIFNFNKSITKSQYTWGNNHYI